MGLDNIPLPKLKPDANQDEYIKVTEQIDEINRVIDEAYYEAGDGQAFWRSQRGLELATKRDALEDLRNTYHVLPAETLGAPRIGVDKEATAWLVNLYETNPHLRERYASVDLLLAAEHGKFVIELAKEKAGVASVSGIAVNATSFRGKCLGYVSFLSESVKNKAYEDMTAGEAVEYGKILRQEAKDFEDGTEGRVLSTEEQEDLDLVRNAAQWWTFWGEHGHGVHAWY